MTETTFERRTREAKEARDAKEAQAAAEKTKGAVLDDDSPGADLVPTDVYELSDEDREMDTVMETVERSGIVNLYNRWNTKGYTAQPRAGQRESIKVRCPWPDHSDEHASAWLNSDKNLFHCGSCDKGGDFLDLAAIKFGFPEYKTEGNQFHSMRRAAASDFGYTFQKKVYGTGYNVIEPEPEQSAEPVPATRATAATQPEQKLAVVTNITEPDDPETGDDAFFFANARAVDAGAFVKEDTFLAQWVEQTYKDSAPDDYNFWHGLVALGLASGRDVFFDDPQSKVWGNLFICLLGPSGVGKTRSQRHLYDLLKNTGSVWKDSDDPPRGVKLPGSPGSGEMLVKIFDYKWSPDPTNPKELYPLTVKALLEYGEYAQLNSIISRQASTLSHSLMGIYDAKDFISAPSLTTGEKYAYEPFGSLITTTQPRMLRKLITQSALDSGFANRFLFVTGVPKNFDEFGTVHIDLAPCYSKYAAIKQWCMAGDKTSIYFDDEAHSYANAYWREHIKPLVEGSDNQLVKRVGLAMKKVILLNAVNEMETVVTRKMLDRSLSLFEYIVRAYGVSADRIGETKLGEIERLVIQAVEHHQATKKQGMSASEFRRKFHRRGFETQDVVRVFENLVKLGELDRQETKTQGKVGAPTLRYKVAT